MKSLPHAPLPLVAFALASLAGCGRETPAENVADTLEEAAEYSTPEAADVLENKAELIREREIDDPEAVDAALEAAGNAQAPGPPPPIRNGQ